MFRFPLSSEQCELLLAFETYGSVFALAEQYGRDVSVISRQLQKIGEVSPVLEKQNGRWRLTPLGKQINHWTRDAVEHQSHLLKSKRLLRIAATREFAARVLAPQLALFGISDETALSVITDESGVESLLLRGDADIGFDCGRPQDPMIRFRAVAQESIGVFASPQFLKRNKIKNSDRLHSLPHLHYSRIPATRALQLDGDLLSIRASFNDIAAAREACCAGLGWAVLPFYAVRRELTEGLLTEIQMAKTIPAEKFGVWWHRERKSLAAVVSQAEAWLEKQGI